MNTKEQSVPGSSLGHAEDQNHWVKIQFNYTDFPPFQQVRSGGADPHPGREEGRP